MKSDKQQAASKGPRRKPRKTVRQTSPSPEVNRLKEVRQNIGREIHDRIGQPLTVMKLVIDRLHLSSGQNSELLDELRGLMHETMVEVRNLCVELQSDQINPDNSPPGSGQRTATIKTTQERAND